MREGWKQTVVDYALACAGGSIPVFVTPTGGRVIGYPLEWVLFADGDPPTPITAVCAVSGQEISPHTGLRCARCAQPVAHEHLKFLGFHKVPSCTACAPEVRTVLRTGDPDG